MGADIKDAIRGPLHGLELVQDSHFSALTNVIAGTDAHIEEGFTDNPLQEFLARSVPGKMDERLNHGQALTFPSLPVKGYRHHIPRTRK